MTRLPDESLVYLVPVGAGRFDLYSEPPDGRAPAAWFRRLQERWRDAVHTARTREPPAGRIARARDWAVRRGAEMIAEQRTLWSLRHVTAAMLVHPSDLAGQAAAGIRDRLLDRARRHHGWWLILDTSLFVVSGVFMLVPGPNIFAYYFALRVVGHYLSWRGARQARLRSRWQLRAEPALTELASLVDVPRDARASQVGAIAIALNLPRLATFFDRTAVPAA
jgi:hypothetical protein